MLYDHLSLQEKHSILILYLEVLGLARKDYNVRRMNHCHAKVELLAESVQRTELTKVFISNFVGTLAR